MWRLCKEKYIFAKTRMCFQQIKTEDMGYGSRFSENGLGT